MSEITPTEMAVIAGILAVFSIPFLIWWFTKDQQHDPVDIDVDEIVNKTISSHKDDFAKSLTSSNAITRLAEGKGSPDRLMNSFRKHEGGFLTPLADEDWYKNMSPTAQDAFLDEDYIKCIKIIQKGHKISMTKLRNKK